MMHVAGGVYLEYCSDPHWEELYGSGGRAAAAVSSLSNRVVLHTYVSKQHSGTLDVLAATFGYQVNSTEISFTPSFTYTHGFSEPVIRPPCIDPQAAPSLRVEGDNILRFGFLEGDAIVNGDYVVYDPQSGSNPRPFSENGSSASHLAIVANQREIVLLTGETDIRQASYQILKGHGAEVVVVKRAAAGAYVVAQSGEAVIPVFRTEKVWPIGSGDVFSAIFAYYWAERRIDPVEAARKASLATALYCSSQVLPIPENPENFPGFLPTPMTVEEWSPTASGPSVYLAGPFFTMSARWLIREARAALQDQGMSVFSPFHDVGYGTATDVAPADLKALEESRAVLAILDGLDAGTLFEVGYARARGIPVIALAENVSDGDLTMLTGTGCRIVSDLSSAIYHTVWTALGA